MLLPLPILNWLGSCSYKTITCLAVETSSDHGPNWLRSVRTAGEEGGSHCCFVFKKREVKKFKVSLVTKAVVCRGQRKCDERDMTGISFSLSNKRGLTFHKSDLFVTLHFVDFVLRCL